MTNKMKLTFLIFVVVFIGHSCSSGQKTNKQEISIKVIDKESNKPIARALVILTSIIDGNDIIKDSMYTDSNGFCALRYEDKINIRSGITAQKTGYISYYALDSINFNKSSITISNTTINDIMLYLTTDSLNHVNYWKKLTIRYDIDTLIQALKVDKYRKIKTHGLPLLVWEDIPKLLEIADDTTRITYFPQNPVSSLLQTRSYLGVISMWMIESIRITEEKGIVDPFSKFPSLNPILKLRLMDVKPTLTEKQKMDLAFNAYIKWWNRIKNLDKKEGSKIDPFEGSNIGW
jgi:hypothetical protein